MKHIKNVIFSVLVFIAATWLNPVQASAETYTWKEEVSVSGNDVAAAWYNENDEKIDGMPINIESDDFITINAAPNEECSLWLKSLGGDMDWIVL